MDIRMNTEFKVILTKKYDRAVYSQPLPMLTNLREDLTVKIALMHNYGIIAVLPMSQLVSFIFVQRKSNGKLRLLVNLRKINRVIADDYTNNNHPVSTLSDAAQNLATKSFFCKLDGSQAYHFCRWRINGLCKCLHSVSLAEQLPTKDLHKVLADLCLLYA